jgi:glyceraldehyde 3-phosphate dehydrogenase (phosphorylating)
VTIKIGINGFGRIGRGLVRAWVENDIKDMEIVAVNDLASIKGLANLLKYDSIHGRLNARVEIAGDALLVNGKTIRMTAHRDPADLPWQDVDLVMECTGVFKSREQAALHLKNGAKKVLISAPGKDMDRTVVYGVNHGDLTADDVIVSNGSCTTNCLAPVAMLLDREFGIKTGYMTTIHAFTASQPTLDSSHKDPYRARAASMSMVPTTTGATKALSLVLPNLKGKIEGSSVRVPTPNVSLVDLSFMPTRKAGVDDVNAVMKRASEGELAGILSYEPDPMVSIDFNHDPHSSCFAPAQTAVTDQGMVRVVSWYDNEWGFTNRMFDTARLMMQLT